VHADTVSICDNRTLQRIISGMNSMNICFIGGGNMATALIGGMLARKFYHADEISVVEINADQRIRLQHDFAVRAVDNVADGILGSQIIVLAVKPQQLREVVERLAPQLSGQLLISIAAGVRAADIARWAGSSAIVRVMPNTPALIGSGVSGLYALPEVTPVNREIAENILKTVGSTLWVEQEPMLDAVTAISGSGPAYVFYFIEALQNAAEQFGFDEAVARSLAVDTFLGAAKLANSSDEAVGVLRTRVTSKNGTTERALMSMASSQVAEHIVQAAFAAEARSREMGDELGCASC
jgi:pyrroline-5-carboxylate reductase